jgi:SAM-dependent methyltransferase
MEKEQDWFSTWFDSPYYHMLYAERDEAEAASFIQALQKRLQIPPNALVLDAACGKGRHAKTLQLLGLTVDAFDLSPQNIQAANTLASENLSFFVHDIRVRVPKHGVYDVVFNFFTSFGYFDHAADNLLAFQTFADALKPGGVLVMDFFNPSYVLANLVREEVVTRGGISFEIKRWEANGFLHKSIVFTDKGKDFQFMEKVELIGKQDFIAYAAQSGLSLVDLLGDYSLTQFDEKFSPRMVFIWQKK